MKGLVVWRYVYPAKLVLAPTLMIPHHTPYATPHYQAIKRTLDKSRFEASREADAAQVARANDIHDSNVALFEQRDKLAGEQRQEEVSEGTMEGVEVGEEMRGGTTTRPPYNYGTIPKHRRTLTSPHYQTLPPA